MKLILAVIFVQLILFPILTYAPLCRSNTTGEVDRISSILNKKIVFPPIIFLHGYFCLCNHIASLLFFYRFLNVC
jgi:hypothetical protein